ncbi:RNA polymerase sigma factor [Schlesneria sp. DSM 10557]|uniref:RNA polymerase sigma factor n=1 Tax=Schlesneria sp. DSM 10557 TaxID=3044399 RepID=UPI0035A05536
MIDEPSVPSDCNTDISDHLLLNRYTSSGSPEPFLHLMRRHMGLVYGTCLRITANVHDAEDISQECFFDLARQAAEIRTSVVGWLHQAATNRALNRLRSDKRRQRHEYSSGLQKTSPSESKDSTPTEASWSELSPVVDEVLSQLPEQLRSPILMHYLEGSTQGEIANLLGVNQSTISRRLNIGIERLRDELRRMGIVVPTATLLSWLCASTDVAASPALTASISKIGLMGVGTSTISATGGWSALSSLYSIMKATIALLFLPVVAGVYWGELAFLIVLALWCAYLGWRRPEWVRILCFTRQDPNIYEWPFFPFSSWNWTSPPPEWRIWMTFHFITGIELLGLTMLPIGIRLWILPIAGALWHLFMAIRIWWHVRQCRRAASVELKLPNPPVDGALLLTYTFVGLLLLAKLCSSPWLFSRAADSTDWFWMSVGCLITWVTLLIGIAVLVICRYQSWLKQGAVDPVVIQRMRELEPPRWVLCAMLGIPLLAALSVTFVVLMLDVTPVVVPFGDNVVSVIRRTMFFANLFALDLIALGVLPLAYLQHRIPKIIWGVTAGSMGLIGILHMGLFSKTVFAVPEIRAQVYYHKPPRLEFAKSEFALWAPPNLLENDSLKPENPYLGSNLTLEVRHAVPSTISIEFGSHQVRLQSPVLDRHRLAETTALVMIVPHDFRSGVPSQLQVTFILVGANRSQQMKQFLLPLPKDMTAIEWNEQFRFCDFREESAHPISAAVQLGTIQGEPLIVNVLADSPLTQPAP